MDDQQKPPQPQVFVLPNGPYYYFTDFTPQPIQGLRGEDGGTYASAKGTALCRCGSSENKPFCDGSHGAIHFNDRKESDGRHDRRKNYAASGITVHDNRAICSHSGICLRLLPGVFDRDRRPWIDPLGATAQEIMAAVRQCPSGALSYSIDGVEFRDYDREPLITVSKDGPYTLVGGITVAGHESRADQVSNEHCTLCRCGSSRNKPFCDGNHGEIGFQDPPDTKQG
jgi:CDGSH-type Zn-finger protein